MSTLPNSESIQSYQKANHSSYDVDLKELFIELWQGKWTVIIFTFVVTLTTIIYALTVQEWWSSKATVSQPQLQDIAGYQQVVKRYQPLFDVYQEDGTIIVSEVLDGLIDSEVIFRRFLQEFNANGTKRRFMQTNATFLELKKELFYQDDPERLQDFYEQWFDRIKVVAVGKKEDAIFTLSFQSVDKISSLTLLREYIQFVNQAINQQLYDDLFNTLVAKYGEIEQQENNLRQQAQLGLKVELERTKYALSIAEAASIEQPLQNLGEQEIFAINIGSRALKAKVDALRTIKDLSVFEPRLALLQGKLEQLNIDKLSVSPQWAINSFYYLDQPELPLKRDKPNRVLIIILGMLLGSMLGTFFILLRFFSKR
ncbi:Wzz/FepE/Etk N-terminal domain-containing protein [Vibrio cholerae]|uniref:LPS O-antigen chain length determinant protein WzzB n=1 Tax=Vibrio cholerae TaxID=666 RepID=UPI000DBE9F72|nr:Wzz/FepE/Etk N-terminal domain-containing protein [Vibrio cholerae]EGQ9463391.1 LPS chain length-determining protein [Vibrio cholerae]EGR2320240.1 LPS chain length-determining protein [Vibrio cholerae]EGR3955542.1 LPS chain length-determining protein [Vibrio cholerae]EGR4180888.1 LPS chain length-determining protein [Vibrio cholerae]EHS1101819.1 LPS O-antigen chain length determinant protein WzzB [Vibrio cholerae]